MVASSKAVLPRLSVVGKPARRPVVNLDAESAVLSALIRIAGKNPSQAFSIIRDENLTDDLFTGSAYRVAYNEVLALLSEALPVDLVTLQGRLKPDESIAVESALNAHVAPSNYAGYVKLLRNLRREREALLAREALAKAAKDGADVADLGDMVKQISALDCGSEYGVSLISADSITPVAYEWLWNGWLCRGKLHLIAGHPGVGKTTIANALAATVSCGGRFPDGSISERGDVLIWSSEDDPQDTLVPRLIANGADRSRVHFCGPVRDRRGVRPFDPSRDFEGLSAACAKYPNLRLLIVDSIADAVSGSAKENNEVRRALMPIKEFSEKLGVATLGVAHFRKGLGGSAMSRVMDSVAFAGMARLVMVAFKKLDHGLVLMRAKSNIGLAQDGYDYKVVQQDLPGFPGVTGSLITWGDLVEGSADFHLQQAESDRGEGGSASADDTQLDKAASFIVEALMQGNGARRSGEVEDEAAAAGISDKTLKRAKRMLGVKSLKGRSEWYWILPGAKVAL